MKAISKLIVLTILGISAITAIPGITSSAHAQNASLNDAGFKGPFATRQQAVNYGVSLGSSYFFHVYEQNGAYFCAYRKRPAGF